MAGRGSVLVTGGAHRIGRSICEALSARGWRVLVHAREGGDVAGDLSRPLAAETLWADAVAVAPDLRAVVNNAAVFSVAGTLPPGEAAAMMRVNAEVPVRLAELAADYLGARGQTGGVVHLLDSRILSPAAADTPYTASKRALMRAVAADARRLAPTVRVNGVAPGPVLAPKEAANREKGGAILLARRPTPEDVAGAVAFLLEAESVTGQVLAVDAGQSLMRGTDCETEVA